MSRAAHRIAVIPGDGIGPEVIAAARLVLEATGLPLEMREYPAGDDCLTQRGVALPEETLRAAKEAEAVLFGAAGDTAAEVILRLRAELETWVNLRPARALAGVECLYPQADLVIVRENTECLYRGLESRLTPEVVTATRLITAGASRRIARFAFDYARRQGYRRVTAVHKANVLRQSDGLFLDCCREAARNHPDIDYQEVLVDAAAMYLVQDPERFQVMVTTNLFGDILSDLAAGLIGGLGLCPSANLGDRHALFEPVHGSAPDIAGQGRANPAAAIMCAAMMLAHLGHRHQAEAVHQALAAAVAEGQTTPDLGGSLDTLGMARAVAERLG